MNFIIKEFIDPFLSMINDLFINLFSFLTLSKRDPIFIKSLCFLAKFLLILNIGHSFW